MNFPYTDRELEAIYEKSRRADRTEPRIANANYCGGKFIFELTGGSITGTSLSFPADSLKPFRGAADKALAHMKLTKTGNAVHWPDLGIEIPAVRLVQVVTGLRLPPEVPAAGMSAHANGIARRKEKQFPRDEMSTIERLAQSIS